MAFLPRSVTSQWVQFVSTPHFQCAAVAVNGRRASMEDSHALECADHSAFLGIFDGHGGRGCADFVARELPARCAGGSAAAQLADAARAVDEAFLQTRPDDPSGCTAAFAQLDCSDGRRTLRFGHVGDARVLVGRGAALRCATVDHSPTHPEEARRIAGAGGLVLGGRVNGALAVARAFGDRAYKAPRPVVSAVPDVAEVHCEEGDVVLLACDGLFEPIALRSSEAVMERLAVLLQSGNTVDEALTSLCGEALHLGSLDNITAILLHFRWGGVPASWHRYIPGRLYADLPDHRRAYCTFAAEAAGLSPAQAVELRYDHLRTLLPAAEPAAPVRLADILDDGGEHSPAALRRELAAYGAGPPSALAGPDRTHWFAALLQEWDAADRSPTCCTSLLSSIPEPPDDEERPDAGREFGPDNAPEADVSDIFHCGNDSELDVDLEIVRALGDLTSPLPHIPSLELSLSTVASQRTCRLSGASSCGRLALSSINLSAAPQCSTTPAKRRRVVDVPDASHDPDSLTPHNSSPGAGAQVEVERLLRCWVERLGAVAGRPTQWLHREVARLLWPTSDLSVSETSGAPHPNFSSPSIVLEASSLFGSPRT
eukprot:EG_transcript_5839